MAIRNTHNSLDASHSTEGFSFQLQCICAIVCMVFTKNQIEPPIRNLYLTLQRWSIPNQIDREA